MSASLHEILQSVHEQGRDRLLEAEAYAFLEELGIETPRHFFLQKGKHPTRAQLDTLKAKEVVLKIVSPQILHKSDVGGIRMVACEEDAVAAALDAMEKDVAQRAEGAEIKGTLVVERIQVGTDLPGSEFILSARRDPAMGPYLMFGLGGLLSEWYGDLAKGRAHMIMSADAFDRNREMDCLAASPLGAIALAPSRLHAKAPLNAEILGKALKNLASVFQEETEIGVPRLEELELNPVVARDGRLLALDALASIAPTPGRGRIPRPIARIANLLHPRSAVVYGASSKHMNAGRIILDNLKRSEGITYGKLWAIHPKADRIDGVPCVANASALPEAVDLAVVSIPAPIAPSAIEELVATSKTRSIILIPGGFAETGQSELADRIEQSLAASRERADGGPVMVGGNCLGIVSKREYNTFFLPHYKLPFHKAPGTNLVAVSQSGAYLVSFTSNLDGIIFPRVSISYGNEMDLTASDFLQYYLDYENDPQVFCFYIEGFQPSEGERFLKLVRRATAENKAVVVYKAGKTPGGAKAAASHTASIAGDYEIARVMLQEAGAIVCETLNQFEDYTKILTMLGSKRAEKRRLGVITNAGFEAGAVSDHLYGLKLTELSEQTCAQLSEVLPEIAHVGNPVDATPMAGTRPFIKAVEILAHAEEGDALVVSAIPATPGLDILAPDLSGQHSENIFSMHSLPSELIRVSKEIDKPMVIVIDSGRLYDSSVLLLERAGLPVYRKIDRASRALSVATDYWIGESC